MEFKILNNSEWKSKFYKLKINKLNQFNCWPITGPKPIRQLWKKRNPNKGNKYKENFVECKKKSIIIVSS